MGGWVRIVGAVLRVGVVRTFVVVSRWAWGIGAWSCLRWVVGFDAGGARTWSGCMGFVVGRVPVGRLVGFVWPRVGVWRSVPCGEWHWCVSPPVVVRCRVPLRAGGCVSWWRRVLGTREGVF